jgi:hypothetical protein
MMRPGCSKLSLESVLEVFHSVESPDTIERYGISVAQVDRVKRANGQPITIFGETLMS